MTINVANSIATSQEIPVEQLLNEAINGFIETHKELSKLPEDPNDPLPDCKSMLRDLGVDVDNDYSMLIMAALGKVTTDAGLSALNLPTASPLSTGLDLASSVLMGLAENRDSDQQAKNKPGAKPQTTSMFKISKFKRDPNKLLKPQGPSTSLMKMALQRKKHLQIKNSAEKRKNLKKQMAKHTETIKDLMVFKSCGVLYAHKVSVPNGETGQIETYLVASKDKPHMALTANGKSYQKNIDVSAVQKQSPMPKMAMGF